MSRIEAKPLSEYPWYVRLVLRRQQRKYGRILAPSLLWGRLPGPFLGMLTSLGFFQSKNFPIGGQLRSLLSVRIAQLNGCKFCIDLNSYNYLISEGAPEKPAEIARWRESDLFPPEERAALEYAEAMTDRCGSISSDTVESVKAYFSEDEVTALTAWIAFQNMSAKFNAALGAEEHGFCRVPGASHEGASLLD